MTHARILPGLPLDGPLAHAFPAEYGTRGRIAASGRVWHTRRISWDGFRAVVLTASSITGEAYAPVGDPQWLPFEVDLRTGRIRGRSYDGPPEHRERQAE